MDLWGVGCVFFEIIGFRPLFPGENELDQINKIHAVIGTPPKEHLSKLRKQGCNITNTFPSSKGIGLRKYIQHASQDAERLILRFLEYIPEDRLTAREALEDLYFREIREADQVAARAAHADTSVHSSASKPRAKDGSNRSRMPAIGAHRHSNHRTSDGDSKSSEHGALPAIGNHGMGAKKSHKKLHGPYGGASSVVGGKHRNGGQNKAISQHHGHVSSSLKGSQLRGGHGMSNSYSQSLPTHK